MNTQEIKKEGYQLALNMFNAMLALESHWDNYTSQMDELLTNEYPFNLSFDDLCIDTKKWIKKIEVSVNLQQFEKAVFSIDGIGAFIGVHNPTRYWNGWSIPYFTKSEAERVLFHLSIGDSWAWSFDEINDKYILTETETGETSDWEGVIIDGQKFYGIGGMFLCWVTEKEKYFYFNDNSGRNGSYQCSLIDIVSDSDNTEDFDETEEQEQEETLIGWAMNAEISEQFLNDNAGIWTRIK